MQDIEFTVEEGRLFLLQTRTGKRTAAAALRVAVEMAGEGLISREEAVARIDPGQLDQLLHPMIDPTAKVEVAARGLNASPGAASGEIVLDADTAEERGKAGDDVILVRWETTPDDIHGLIQARGVLTAHGGMTSHAAVVARGMGKPCVAGCEGLSIDARRDGHDRGARARRGRRDHDRRRHRPGDRRARAAGAAARSTRTSARSSAGPTSSAGSRVRANADTPEDAAKAREFGAEGIGLCRTEHMFMAQDRLPVVQEMIMAATRRTRRAALDRLLPMQQSDFEGIFEAMAGLPGHDPAARPAVARVPALARGGDLGRRCAAGSPSCTSRIRCSAPAAAGSGCNGPRSTRCRCARSSARPQRWGSGPGRRRSSRSCIRSSASARSCARLRELTERIAAEEPAVEYLCGTMIELPRACVRADEIAEVADFCSFGTNDLTQTALGFSRDDAEGKFLTYYLEHGILERNPFEVLDQEGVGELMRIAVERGRGVKPGLKLGSAASTAASRARSPSATGSGSTTSAARPTGFRWHGWRPRRQRSPKRV